MTLYWIFGIIAVGVFILVFKGSQMDTTDEPVKIKAEEAADRYVNKIKTYFFTKDMFDFEKFCDYIMCIRDDMSINDYSEMLIELDSMIKLSQGLKERIVSILTYDSSILSIKSEDFLEMQKNIRENRYENTFKNLVIILITTLFYLKSKTIRNINIEKGDDIL